MKFTTESKVVMGALTAVFLSGWMSAAQAQFSMPDSASQLIELSGLSGAEQGVEMDGSRPAFHDDDGFNQRIPEYCDKYVGGKTNAACEYGLSGGPCSIYTDASELAACQDGLNRRNNPPSDGGGSLDPLFGVMALGLAGLAGMGNRKEKRPFHLFRRKI